MKKFLLSLVLSLLFISNAIAYDFIEDGIYYYITDSNEVVVTCDADNYYSQYGSYSGSVIIPSTVSHSGTVYNVTGIGNYAFAYSSDLTNVTIPSSVSVIGDYAFYNCTSLSQTIYTDSVFAFLPYSYSGTYTIPSGIQSIAACAFENRTNLTSVIIPTSVTNIGYYAFSSSGLTSINIPNSVTSIGEYAFNSCAGLTQPVYNNTIFAYLPASYSGPYIIPFGIKTIAIGAFQDCQGVNVTIPTSMTTINDYAFLGCTGITGVTIPNSVTKIGGSAFYNCTNLSGVTIPNSVTKIGGYAFCSCNNLSHVTIPASVDSFGSAAFAYCSSLTNVTISDSLTALGDFTFAECSSLTTINLPSSLSVIPNELFYNCSRLHSITIPANVTSIGQAAFRGCSRLQNVTCEAITPPSASGAFEVKSYMTLYVPQGCYDAYYHADGWSDFYPNIICPVKISVFTEDYDKGTASGDSIYMANSYAIIYGCPNHGYRFDRWNDGNRNNPRILQVSQDSSFTAYFMPDTFRVNVRSNDPAMGSVSGSGKYLYNDLATIML